jgi:hypothetical protein
MSRSPAGATAGVPGALVGGTTLLRPGHRQAHCEFQAARLRTSSICGVGSWGDPRRMSAQDASLADFVFLFRQHSRFFQAKVLAHFVAQVLGPGRPACGYRDPHMCSQLLAETPNGTEGSQAPGEREQSRPPVHAEEGECLRRPIDADQRRTGGQAGKATGQSKPVVLPRGRPPRDRNGQRGKHHAGGHPAPGDVAGKPQARIDKSQIEHVLRNRTARLPRPHGQIVIIEQSELDRPERKPAADSEPRMDLARGAELGHFPCVGLEKDMFSRSHSRCRRPPFHPPI